MLTAVAQIKAEPDPEVCDVLRKALVRAERGEVSGVLVLEVQTDGVSWHKAMDPADHISALGLLRVVETRLIEELEPGEG